LTSYLRNISIQWLIHPPSLAASPVRPAPDLVHPRGLAASICGRTLYFSEYNAYQYADASCLYALDLATGTEKWRYATQGSVSSPVIDDGVLYIGTEDGQLIALKQETEKAHHQAAPPRGLLG
jgi:outer membrane protein assembly factor BamB